MADIVDSATRNRMMTGIRSRNTRPDCRSEVCSTARDSASAYMLKTCQKSQILYFSDIAPLFSYMAVSGMVMQGEIAQL